MKCFPVRYKKRVNLHRYDVNEMTTTVAQRFALLVLDEEGSKSITDRFGKRSFLNWLFLFIHTCIHYLHKQYDTETLEGIKMCHD